MRQALREGLRHQWRGNGYFEVVKIFMLTSLFFAGARAQVGETLCACQPSVWEIDIDFELNCNNNTFMQGPGISEATCQVAPLQPNVIDFEFVSVSLIMIMERDQNRLPVGDTTFIPGPFANGDQFSYMSIVDSRTDFNTTSLPKEIQFDFQGINSVGESIRATWSLAFTNNCSVFPVVEPGELTINGEIAEVVDPPKGLCPISVPIPSSVPSSEPSMTPSNEPTVIPSDSPVSTPSTSTPTTSNPTFTSMPTDSTPQVGIDICGCQPGTWDFTFDFNLNCSDQTFIEGPGIYDVSCQVTVLGIGEPTFKNVSFISIIEIDQNLKVIEQTQFGPVSDGDGITYTSVLETMESFNETSLPGGIQMIIQGSNGNGATIIGSWAIDFTNNCSVFPVVTDADETLITNVTQVTNPPEKFCPLAALPSGMPSIGPTDTPTFSPVISPSQEPSSEPSSKPTQVASDGPSSSPTVIVSEEPSLVPSLVVSDEPSQGPTIEPTSASIEPTAAGLIPTLSPTESSEAPSKTIAPSCPPIATKSPKSSKGSKSPGSGKGNKSKKVTVPEGSKSPTRKTGTNGVSHRMRTRGLREQEGIHYSQGKIHSELQETNQGDIDRELSKALYYLRKDSKDSKAMSMMEMASMKSTKTGSPSFAPTSTPGPTCPDPYAMKSKKKGKKSSP
uniref:Reelin domain-containing protein n=1 Tax=Entomoneis paludosa TaxID=265537 RepID=A0A7S2Y324_9STRA|mmetsp:Transcript_12502/g.25900  ORF Transcript_12502/g.25900 Transcript_12502/m.25900 type:complete len:673 (+) Transcript_12502:147-2165(+)